VVEAGALRREQTVVRTQGETVNMTHAAREESLQFPPGDAVDSALATDPEVAVVILDQIQQKVFREPVLLADALKAAIRTPANPGGVTIQIAPASSR